MWSYNRYDRNNGDADNDASHNIFEDIMNDCCREKVDENQSTRKYRKYLSPYKTQRKSYKMERNREYDVKTEDLTTEN